VERGGSGCRTFALEVWQQRGRKEVAQAVGSRERFLVFNFKNSGEQNGYLFFQNKGDLYVFEEAASEEKTLIMVRTPDNQTLKESRVGGFWLLCCLQKVPINSILPAETQGPALGSGQLRVKVGRFTLEEMGRKLSWVVGTSSHPRVGETSHKWPRKKCGWGSSSPSFKCDPTTPARG